MSNSGWIGVDLDGTLAAYDGWKGLTHIGKPVPAMVERIKLWLAEGWEVRIFTARVSDGQDALEVRLFRDTLKRWLLSVGLPPLEVTNVKDFHMVELWDDRAVTVEPNTGRCLVPTRNRQGID
ncbi:hypothetical protein [Mesorhizobium sp. WSM4982]|uniref:hypothetical protein n=1 Tax=Mesorhizobium sp. WSM4982 TaxID=3038550 RepID=UPI0024151A40|nr:hypothetical protein [Mesorhizobium sp. WSM4982]MDG4856420.1 hypothetical protein [Mesorhizobium sp. WSM4982]